MPFPSPSAQRVKKVAGGYRAKGVSGFLQGEQACSPARNSTDSRGTRWSCLRARAALVIARLTGNGIARRGTQGLCIRPGFKPAHQPAAKIDLELLVRWDSYSLRTTFSMTMDSSFACGTANSSVNSQRPRRPRMRGSLLNCCGVLVSPTDVRQRAR